MIIALGGGCLEYMQDFMIQGLVLNPAGTLISISNQILVIKLLYHFKW